MVREREEDGLRQGQVRERVIETGLPLVYLNRVGGQDELVFDGSSFVTNDDGSIAVQLPDFEEAMELTDWVRTPNGWRCEAGQRAALSPYPEDMYRAMMLALRDYVSANGFPGVILGLSGGIDSALSAAVAVDALGADRVWCVMLPSKYTSDDSLEDAAACARLLNVRHDVIPIVAGIGALDEMLARSFEGGQPGLAEENIQSRLRMVTLMALSNRFGHMLLTTGNKSEMAVGYCTLYGDMAGGFAVIKDIAKTLVYRLCAYRNSVSDIIPDRILTRAPSAELRPDQTDQDTLPPYDVLDAILEHYVEQDRSPDEIVALGFDREVVERVAKMVKFSEYKRKQAPVGLKVTSKAFGTGRRMPIAAKYL